jgi:TrmH family RNA methyltransferase
MLIKPQVKYIQSLSQKKLRDEESVFVAEGIKIINELLCEDYVDLKQLFAVEEWIADHHALVSTILPGKVNLVSESELGRLSFLSTPNQVLGVFGKPRFPLAVDPVNTLSIMLDTIQDPGNIGTIVRCADWFGIRQIICSRDSADVYGPKSVQSSMASIGRVQVIYTDLAEFLQQYPSVPVFAATLDGMPVDQLSQTSEGIILIGNESKGVRDELLQRSKYRITIPRKGRAESLNAAVATGIILSKLT